MNPLAEERDFLLRSLEDLEAERAAGAIDEETYDSLHADYTARAAAVLRAIERGEERSATAEADARAGRLRIGVWVGVVAFAILAAVSLSFAMGARLPGQLVTGGAPGGASGAAGTTGRAVAVLEARVRANPEDPRAVKDLARAYLAQREYAKALEQFVTLTRLTPGDPEPFAYSGWIARLAGLSEEGMPRIEQAIAIDPDYPDAHFFRGVIFLRDRNDPASAIPEFQLYLAAEPDGPQSDAVRQLLAEATTAVAGDVPSITRP
jgi:tetratricopeptide (TPR) repeat protein